MYLTGKLKRPREITGSIHSYSNRRYEGWDTFGKPWLEANDFYLSNVWVIPNYLRRCEPQTLSLWREWATWQSLVLEQMATEGGHWVSICVSANPKKGTPAPGTLSEGVVLAQMAVSCIYLFASLAQMKIYCYCLGQRYVDLFCVEGPQLPPLYLKHKNETYSNFKINMYFKKLEFYKV